MVKFQVYSKKLMFLFLRGDYGVDLSQNVEVFFENTVSVSRMRCRRYYLNLQLHF